jgi:uncharacterized metal-binding protein
MKIKSKDDEKIALAACTGMSPNGLVARVAVFDAQRESNNIIHICIPSTAAESNKSIYKIMGKYPIIGVNGCNNNCVNKILESKNIKVEDTINVDKELENCSIKPKDPARCGKDEEIAIDHIKNIILKKIKK